MPNFAIISDQHWGVNGDNPFFLDNYVKFYDNIFFPGLVEHKVKAVLIPGDFWQSRKNINPLTLSIACKEFFAKLEAMGMPVFIAYGNHDVYYKNTNTVNTIDFLGEMFDNVTVVPTHLSFDNITLMSWICPDNQVELYDVIEKAPTKYLVGHFEIEGHEMTPGYPCQHGLSKGMFANWEKVVSGHFHVRGDDGLVFYTSNPSQTNWADYGAAKGFHILNDETGELTPIDNPYEVYAVHDYDEYVSPAAVIGDPLLENLRDKIVKIVVTSYVDVNLDLLKKFIVTVTEIAHKVVVVETEKFTAKTELEVGEDIKVMSIRDVLVDFAKETAIGDNKDDVAAAMGALYDKATS